MTKLVSLTTLMLLLAGVAGAVADVMRLDFDYDEPSVSRGTDGDFVELAGCQIIAHVGEPLLPVYGVSVLLPAGHELEGLKVVPGDPVILPGTFDLAIAQRQYPLSYEGPVEIVELSDRLKGSPDPHPAYFHANETTHFLAGHGLGNFTLHPVRYIPATGTLLYYPHLSVLITTAATPRAQKTLTHRYRGSDLDRKRIQRATAFTRELSSYPAPRGGRDDDFDLLLIAGASLLPGYDQYIAYKSVRGWKIATETVTDIYSSYSGIDNQDKIRNCIIDYYTNHGIQYVLLGGDDDVIPHRGFWDDAGGYENEYDVAADLYYAGLDGTWNDDGDSRWAEAGEDDLMAEVYVGRVCADDITELSNFIDKTIMYEDSPVVGECDEALMVGELLWASTNTYAKMYKEEIRLGSDSWGYTTVGFPNPAQVETLYDQDFTWNASADLFPFLNGGVHLVNHLGHSNVGYYMKFYNSSVNTTNMTNNGTNHSFYITYSQGCYNGSFDSRNPYGGYESYDCISEKMTLGIPTGAVAAVANSRYGWASHGDTQGSSQYFDRQFFDAIFGEGITNIGWANQDSKEDNIWIIDYGQNRWCYYELTVFGDPTLDIWTAEPTVMAVNHQAALVIGESSFQVSVDGLEGARVGLSVDGQLVGRGFTDASGTALVEFDTPPTATGTMDIWVTAHDRLSHHSSVPIISPVGPYVVYRDHLVDDDQSGASWGDADGQVELGETIELGLQLDNVGSETALGVTATLSTDDSYVAFSQDTQTFGDITAGSQAWAQGSYVFSIGSNCPDQTGIRLQVEATAASDTWESWVSIMVNAPVLSLDTFTITEVDGDGNGKPDPGETIALTPVVANTGHGSAWEVNGHLQTANAHTVINVADAGFGDIVPSSTGEAAPQFEVYFDPSTPSAELVSFDLYLTSGGGYVQTLSLMICVGQKSLLFVDTDNEATETRITAALDNLGENYDTWNWYIEGSPGLQELMRYETIIWAAGDQNISTCNAQDRTDLASFLDNGGKLLFSAENYLSDYADESFTTAYLHIQSYEINVAVYPSAVGQAGDPMGDGLEVDLSYHSQLSEYPDKIEPDAQSAVVFRSSSTNESCVIRYPASGERTYRVIVFGVPLEAFSETGSGDNNIAGVIRRSLTWLRGSGDLQPPTAPPWINLLSDGLLSWGAATDNVGVTAYRIYRQTVPYFDPTSLPWIRETSGTTSPFPGSVGDTETNYYFVVTACDEAGNESSPSTIVGEHDLVLDDSTP